MGEHLCNTCNKEFPSCDARRIVWGIDRDPSAQGAEADIVLECDKHRSTSEPVSVDKPTRKAWEEWAWRTAIEVWPVNTNLENRILLKDALLTMPGVPKE